MKVSYLKHGLIAASAVAMVSFTNPVSLNAQQMEPRNTLTEQEIESGVFTPEVMWKMGRIASPAVSPDGKQTVFSTTYYDVEENRGYTSLYVADNTTNNIIRLTDEEGNDSDPSWNRQGDAVFFISDRSGEAQVWKLDCRSGQISQISFIDEGIEGFGINSDETAAFYIKRVKVEDRLSSDIYSDTPKSKGLIYDDLMERHWDYWDHGIYSHIFISELNDGAFSNGKDIMAGEPWDAPMAPYFDNDEIRWSNSGKLLAYTCKKLTGTDYAVSTDSDIYIYDLASGITRNYTEGMVGYDKYPVFSPDDTKLAFQSMARPGNESDKDRLFVIDLHTGEKKYITENFDYNASNIVWEDNKTILFISPIEATRQICRTDLKGNVKVLTSGDHDITSFSYSAGKIVATLTKMSLATELFAVDAKKGALSQMTNVNAHVYDNIPFGEVQKRWVTTTDGKQMLVWVILPPNFDPNEKYPTLLYCQGGPQDVVSQFWSYRWNFQLMAAQGYVIVAPNRRGLPSFGQEWLDQISGDYSGQNIRDYLSAIDDVAAEPWSDSDRLGCVGASYGGYSVFFLAGHHEKRFKGLIAHCGIFNFESMYGSTEELFFVNNDYGGSYWSDSPTAQRSFANSPHKFVQNWDTPILIITGLKDFRIPYTQSLEAFTAARLMGLPSRLVAFEDEAHQVFKPQNSLVWNREFFSWLDKYVKNAE